MSTENIDILNDLIRTCNDGRKGFDAAAEDVKRPDLRELLQAGARRCGEAATELTAMVRAIGGQAAEGGSAAGALHRGWLEVKAGVTGHSDLAILEECERGEDSAKKSYKNALEKEGLSAAARIVVERQYQGVLANHDHVRQVRDSLKQEAHA
ncbi:MAG: hypothetical protein JWN73_3698 [Betaproteobacteria bacterium]|nr:hypothetical protein [Betaproteobacteria bacterium]